MLGWRVPVTEYASLKLSNANRPEEAVGCALTERPHGKPVENAGELV
jgi:hypothetical protein